MYEAKLCCTVSALNLQESKNEISLTLDILLQINVKQERDYLLFQNALWKIYHYFEEARGINKLFILKNCYFVP